MLGIRTTVKEDLQCSSAELVYGTTLRLPGEFFDTARIKGNPDPVCYVSSSTPPTKPNRKMYIDPALQLCTHVFVRHDGVRASLQPPYDGPYEVVKRQDKYYTIHINGKERTVSIDRLKPAHIELPVTSQAAAPTVLPSPATPTPTPSPAPRTTRTGRRVR